MMQFGSALTRVAGEPLPDLLQRRIFGPIGLRATGWEKAGDVPNWTGGFQTTAPDFARFGLLFLRRGEWNGRRLVDPRWVDEATRVQAPASLPFDPISSRQEGPGVYGYNWWVNGVRPDGARHWPGAPPRTFAACGHNNNMCFVVPEWDLVLVRLGTDGNIDRKVWGTFFEKLGAAIN
jgi:CubicO group peptidase (beta-lactamase class C family)